MPRRVGKEVAQQVEVAPMSPRHSEGENSPKHLPPIFPLADRSYGNPIYRNDDEEKVQFNRQQQNNPAGGILGPQDPVEAAFRAAEQLNANQQRYVPPARRPNAAPHPNFQNNAFQPLGLQAASLPLDRNQLIDLVQETYGPALRPLVRPSYHKPYPDYIDRDNPFPRGFKMPEFTLFSRDTSQSTIEHIGRFTIQCGEASGDDFLKLRLFPSSLTGTALTWYLSLPQNFVFTWRQMEDLFHIQFYRSEPEVSMADLSRLTQQPRESSENYLMRDFFELSYKVARYENLLREEFQRKAASQGTYYQDAFDLDVAEDKIDKGLLRFPEKPKEAMGVDENPFPNVDVGVNVADIRSISRRTWEKVVHPKFLKEPVKNPRTLRRRLQRKRAEACRCQQLATKEVKVLQHSLVKGRMVWKRKESKEVAVQNESQPEVPPLKLTSLIVNENELKATFEVDQQVELTSDDNLFEDMDVLQIGDISINLSCLVLTLPLVFQAKGSETTHVPTHVSKGIMVVEEEVIEPLYISAHMDGVPVNRVLVDNGAVVNVIPSFMLRNLGKNYEDLIYNGITISDFTGGVSKSKGVLPVALTVGSKTSMSAFFVVDSSAIYNVLLRRDWIHSNRRVPSTLHQRLIFWNGGKTEVVYADNRPFLANSIMVEARYYDEDVGTIHFFGMDRQGRPRGITSCNKPTLAKYVVDEMDDLRADVQDPLKEVNLGTKAEPHITFVSGLLSPEMRDKIICLLHEFKDCFAWDYSEMPGLDRELVEHKLPINKGYKSYKQPSRRMSPKVILKVKEEVERLHKVGFIRTARYSKWLSNIVPVVKKNGKLRVCIDFRNLNLSTPKDEYPMPVADLLVNGVARHHILSFMDGHSGYNQIFIAEEDISKTTFRCPRNISTYEWVVMPFGLKNKAVKRQALADFLAGHPCLDVNVDEEKGINLFSIDLVPWRLIFDGSMTDQASGAGIIIVSPDGIKTQWCFQLDFECTNNQAEYEALVICLELLVELKVPSVEIVGDFQLVLKQLSGEYKYTSMVLSPYFAIAIQLLEEFDDASLKHIPHNMNIEANELAQIASGVKMPKGIMEKVIIIEKRMLPSIHQRGITVEACSIDVTPTDWRHPIIEHLRNPSSKTSKRTRMQALNYVLLGDVLYRRGQDELLLRCLGLDKSCHVMSDVHNGICSAHQAGTKMRWLIRRHGFFWPSILKDCINYAKGCRACQLHGPLQRAPASEFVLPETITSDQGTTFVGSKVEAFAKDMGFHLLNSSLHYAQANGQAEASNKIIINILEKMVTPFSLTYGHDAVLPMELTTRSLRIAIQNGLNSREYNEAMIMELEDLKEARLIALDVMKVQKLKVARAYNKRVKQKNLAEGSWVWKAVLPLGKKDPRYRKWSPNWERPFQIHKVLKGGAYWLKSLNGELHSCKINGIYLKPYYPIVWEARDSSASMST
ncbi:hypothetical protein SLEP1_g15430 [Rubroshorea leprosula]|uniref:Integrase catalytic domain-containing protein n=1 Tax=Rubroshorea leprosula TaxID=152421 RepID=A0AAV5IV34_9ROSI|nr:hypothetical protein SLEP1_g15430 [Rubroshorea leprosula]